MNPEELAINEEIIVESISPEERNKKEADLVIVKTKIDGLQSDLARTSPDDIFRSDTEKELEEAKTRLEMLQRELGISTYVESETKKAGSEEAVESVEDNKIKELEKILCGVLSRIDNIEPQISAAMRTWDMRSTTSGHYDSNITLINTTRTAYEETTFFRKGELSTLNSELNKLEAKMGVCVKYINQSADSFKPEIESIIKLLRYCICPSPSEKSKKVLEEREELQKRMDTIDRGIEVKRKKIIDDLNEMIRVQKGLNNV